jgi:hypothetical protein
MRIRLSHHCTPIAAALALALPAALAHADDSSWGPVHAMDTNALHRRKRPAQGAKAKAGAYPASLSNAAMGVFGSNPKGTDGLGRHSSLLSSPRPPGLGVVGCLDCRPMPTRSRLCP